MGAGAAAGAFGDAANMVVINRTLRKANDLNNGGYWANWLAVH
jgi:hypothetical protein